MPRFILLCLAAFLLIGSVSAADLPFVFSEDTPPLAGLSAAQIQDLAAAAPDLAGLPAISQVPENELMEWTDVGGTTVASGATKSTAGELKQIFNSRVEPGNELVHDTVMMVVGSYTGSFSLYQVCAIYNYLNSGDDSTSGWSYYPDPRGVDLYYYANKTLTNGQRMKASGAGDCDDFAILMASLVESIGGTTRIILAYNQSVGHAYTEVYLGSVNEPGSQVEDVIEALKEHYGVSEVFTHLDTTSGEVWLNLDWWPDGGVLHPGGPFFPGTKHIPLRIRDQYGKTPMRPPEGFSPRPAQGAPAVEMAAADGTGFLITHGDSPVHSVAFSPDGRILASVSVDNTVKLWDVGTGREIRTLEGHSDKVPIPAGAIFSVAFSPDGLILASKDRDFKTIRLWDVQTGSELRTLAGQDWLNSNIAFSTDGQILAVGSVDDTVNLWDVGTGREIRTLVGHSSSVYSVAFSPDGRTLASGGWDDTIRLWDVVTGREIRTLVGHSSSVKSVAFSPDGQTLASASRDNTVRLWDVGSGREIRTLVGHSSSVYSVAFSPDGRTLASGGWDDTIRLWDVVTGREIQSLKDYSTVFCVAFSPDGLTLAWGCYDGTIHLLTGPATNAYGSLTSGYGALILPSSSSAAAEYCEDQGYDYRNGRCYFPDGTSCEEWAFYRGECSYNPEPIYVGTLPSAAEYCEDQGYNYRNGRCYFPDGTSCEEWAFYHGHCSIDNPNIIPLPRPLT